MGVVKTIAKCDLKTLVAQDKVEGHSAVVRSLWTKKDLQNLGSYFALLNNSLAVGYNNWELVLIIVALTI